MKSVNLFSFYNLVPYFLVKEKSAQRTRNKTLKNYRKKKPLKIKNNNNNFCN